MTHPRNINQKRSSTYLEKTRSHIHDLIDDLKKSNERKTHITMIICYNYDW